MQIVGIFWFEFLVVGRYKPAIVNIVGRYKPAIVNIWFKVNTAFLDLSKGSLTVEKESLEVTRLEV